MNKNKQNILWFKDISKKNISLVGGKNASLGEMFSEFGGKGLSAGRQGINIPDGFCLTSKAYWFFLESNGIKPEIRKAIKNLDSKNLDNLKKTSRQIRKMILRGVFPEELKKEISKNYKLLCRKYGENNLSVAVRSSATAEDLPSASFAGQHETYLNIKGEINLFEAIKKCISSLFLERAIVYREEKGFDHLKIALSVGVQKMVRSESASSGVMFTIDTETGFSGAVLINSIYGVGEMIVKGKITPDEFYVSKPLLKQGYKSIFLKNLGRKNKKYVYSRQGGLKEVAVDKSIQLKFSLEEKEIMTLAKWALIIEEHYGRPQDIEWAKDGKSKKLFIVQSRPETIHGSKLANILEEYQLKKFKQPILTGIAVGEKIGTGKVKIVQDVSKAESFKKGEVLATKMTDPDWLPLMRIASAIVTDEGGKTCHAAIVAREIGIPAIVGAGGATKILKNGQEITVDCSNGSEGRIFQGKIKFNVKKYNLKKIPKLKTKIMVNIGVPETAFKSSLLPQDGVGLAREEFIIAEKIKIHPLALFHFNKIKDQKIKRQIEKITVEYKNKKEYFIKELAEGIGQIAAAFWPKPVIVRFSDFKTNEYKKLIGGELFEPNEENPMLGWRGASRYYDEKFKQAFLMECEAVKKARNIFGFKNIKLMIPFCRTPEEGKKVLEILRKSGLQQGRDGLEIYVMAEIPSNIDLAEEFLEIFDGMSIGSNDLTQLVLGIDRDNSAIQKIANENNPAVRKMIAKIIRICREKNKYCGICGQAPSDYPEFAEFLVKEGIKSISLNPDTVIKTILNLNSNFNFQKSKK